MTDFYVRPSGGSYGAEDGTSYADAWDGFADISWGAGAGQVGPGDTLYVCDAHAGERLTCSEAGTSGSPIIVRGDYPSAAGSITRDGAVAIAITADYVTIRDLSATTTTSADAIDIASSTGITLQDVTIPDCAGDGINLTSPNGSTHDGHIFRRLNVTNAVGRGLRWYAGFNGGTMILTNITIDSCTFTGCGQHQIDFFAESDTGAGTKITNIALTDNVITGGSLNGVRIWDDHDATSNSQNITITDNNIDGNTAGVVIVGFGSSNADYGDNVISGNSFSDCVGEANGMILAYSSYVRVHDNVASGNEPNAGIGDAVGLDVDIGCSEVEVYHNTCSNNIGSEVATSGPGILVLSGDTKVWANRGAGNKNGIRTGNAITGVEILNNTFSDCAHSGVVIGTGGAGISLYNNIFTAGASNDGYKVQVVAGAGTVEDYNDFSGTWNSETLNHTLGANDLSVDPLLDAEGRPQNSALFGVATKWWGKESRPVGYDGEPFPDVNLDIGAFQGTSSPTHPLNA